MTVRHLRYGLTASEFPRVGHYQVLLVSISSTVIGRFETGNIFTGKKKHVVLVHYLYLCAPGGETTTTCDDLNCKLTFA